MNGLGLLSSRAHRMWLSMLGLMLAGAIAGCDALPGRPRIQDQPRRPDQVNDFTQLYAANCAGCHGAEGRYGPAIALNNPVYLALVDAATLCRTISEGVPGTAMPPAAQSAGGALTDAQVTIIAQGILTHWGHAGASAGAPPYSGASGDAAAGAKVFAIYCQDCHGVGGQGGTRAGSIVAPAFLALISNQDLRSLIIAGRPDLGHPDWRSYQREPPLSAAQVSDLVAWLAARRVPAGASPMTPAAVR